MSYKNDGTPHKSGVGGEKQIVTFLNDKSNSEFITNSLIKTFNTNINKNLKSYSFQQTGGTSRRDDVECVNNNIKISVKSKKIKNGKYKGTFDLLNTTLSKEIYVSKNNKDFEDVINNLNNYIKECSVKKYSHDDMKKAINNYASTMVEKVNGSIIENVFYEIFNKDNDTIHLIRDYKENISEKIKKEDLHFLKKDWVKCEFEKLDLNYKITSFNKSSSFLKRKDGTSSPFRVRIVLNNGVKALRRMIGLEEKIKGKNNNSVMTIKIQVDKILDIVNQYDVNK